MTKSFMRLIMLAFLGTGLVPLVTVTCSWLNVGVPLSSGFLFKLGCSVSAVLLATAGFYVLLRKFQSRLDANAREQEDFLSALAPQHVDLAILSAAALSLFLELALIRWQGTVFEFFAFYKNFSLLCCFAGLGLGYALADRHRIPLGLTIPLLGWQLGLMIVLRFSMPMWRLQSLRILPFREQLNMPLAGARNLSQAMAIYFFLSVIFLLTVLAFIPIGQLCGRLEPLSGSITTPALGVTHQRSVYPTSWFSRSQAPGAR